MPRKRKAARHFSANLDFARQLQKHFRSPWAIFKKDGDKYPVWVDSEVKRGAFERAHEAAVTAQMQQSYAKRTEMLRARIIDWKPWMWDGIFRERPSLLEELSASQREAFDEAMQQVKTREAAADAKRQLDAQLVTLAVSASKKGG